MGMTVAMTIVVLINAPWTFFLAFFALMAESGGKHPSPLAAGIVVWALVEIVSTAIRSMREPPINQSRRVLQALCIGLLIVRPGLDLLLDLLLHSVAVPWQTQIGVSGALAILFARLLRRAWRPESTSDRRV